MATFTIDLAKYAEARKSAMGDVVREIVIQAAALVDERSPVGQPEIWASNISRASRGLSALPAGYIGGHFRANNQYKFGTPATNEVEGEDSRGAATVAAIKTGVLASPVAGMHYISNNVPYAQALENGHSTQAPNGMYGLTAIDVANAARAIIKEKFG